MWNRGLSFWPAYAIVLCIIGANIIPGIWSVTLLAKVQFPWRILTLVDFVLATSAAVALKQGFDRKRLAIAFAPLALLSAAVMALPLPNVGPTLQQLDATMPDVPEYRRTELPDNGKAVIAADAAPMLQTGQLVTLLSLLALTALSIISFRSNRGRRPHGGRQSAPLPAPRAGQG
jgi:hypothetical protein